MPLDHYVSQTHLRQFYSPALGQRFYATKKSDLSTFTADSYSQCRVRAGSTNSYLSEPRAIEDFLTGIEPHYNEVVARLQARGIDQHCVYVIAGFVAYVQSCSPAGMRIAASPLRSIVEDVAKGLDARGAMPLPPESLGGATLTELLESGRVSINADQKFPQAVGISSICEVLNSLGNFHWEILSNPVVDSPFMTSDFPIAVEQTSDPRIINKIVPLSPRLAVRIRPRFSAEAPRQDFRFDRLTWKFKTIGRAEVREINRLLVRCAEATVYYRDDLSWIQPFIKEGRRFRIESVITRFPTERGMLMVSAQRAVEAFG